MPLPIRPHRLRPSHRGIESLESRRLLSAGDLDPSFGAGGKVLTDLPGSLNEFGAATVVQADGKIVAAGNVLSRDDLYGDFLVARYDADGSLDATFGGGDGFVTVDFGGRGDVAYDVAIAPGSKIVVSGYSATTVLPPMTASGPTRESGRDFAVARLNADGSPDASFYGDGKRLIDFGSEDIANDLVVRPDGGVYLVGGKGYPTSATAIAALHPDGRLDSSFDRDGLLVPTWGEGATAATLDGNGRLVVTASGNSRLGAESYFYLRRLNPNGTPDASFGGGLISPTPGVVQAFDSNPTPRDVADAPDGKIVLAGGFGAMRVNANGSPDTTFGGDGTAGGPAGFGLAVAPDRSVLIAGYPFPAPGAPYVSHLARFLEDGSPDASFNATPAGPAGQVRNGTGSIRAVALTADGGSVTVGSTQVDARGNVDLVVTRRTASGALAPTFSPGGDDGDGVAVTDLAGPTFNTVADVIALPGGGTVAVGVHLTGAARGYDFALARYTESGVLDPAFGTGSVVYTDHLNRADVPSSLALQPDGKLLVSGRSGGSVVIFRYNADGSPDTSFGSGGFFAFDTVDGKPLALAGPSDPLTAQPAPMTLLADGRIVLAVSAGTTASRYNFALARLTPGGQPDPTFGGGDGFAVDASRPTGTAAAVDVAPGGKIVVAGTSGSSLNSPGTTVVARYLPDGTLDDNFAVAGVYGGSVGPAAAVAVAADGSITVGASAPGATANFSVLRLAADGLPDRTFGSAGGTATADFGDADLLRDLVLLPDGSVVAVGTTPADTGIDPHTSGDFAVARFTPAGVLDTASGAADGAADGMLKVNLAGFGDAAAAVAMDSAGRLVVAGGAYVPGRSRDFALVRLDGGPAPAPAIEGLSFDASAWTGAFRSALAAAGWGQYGGYTLQRYSVLQPLPWANLDHIAVRFAGPVEGISLDSLSVRGATVASYAFGGFNYDPATHVATWTLAQPVNNDKLVIGLNTAGDAAAEYAWRVNVLGGDVTGDGVVNSQDLSYLKQRLNRTLSAPGTGPAKYTVFADVTGDGRINAGDLAAVKQRLNRRLPAGTPAALAAASSNSVTRDFFGEVPIL